MAKAATQAVANTTEAMRERLPEVLPTVADAPPVETPSEEAVPAATLADRRFDIRFRDKDWSINVELTDDAAESQWLAVNDTETSRDTPRRLNIRVSVAHPFMVRFAQNDTEDLEAMLRIAAAMALAEVLARDAGVRKSGTVRRNFNDILRQAFSEA
jgi:hypothetical protein